MKMFCATLNECNFYLIVLCAKFPLQIFQYKLRNSLHDFHNIFIAQHSLSLRNMILLEISLNRTKSLFLLQKFFTFSFQKFYLPGFYWMKLLCRVTTVSSNILLDFNHINQLFHPIYVLQSIMFCSARHVLLRNCKEALTLATQSGCSWQFKLPYNVLYCSSFSFFLHSLS